MHIVHLTAPVDMGGSFGVLPAGDWLMTNQNAFEIALMAERGTVTMDHFTQRGFVPTHHAMIMRSGAIGDLLLLSPSVQAFRRDHPEVKVSLCCFEKHFPIFNNTDLFDSLIPYPYARNQPFEGLNQIISLENIIELSTDTHATDAFASALSTKVDDYKPVYKVSEEEKSDAMKWKKSFCSRPLVGIQMRASSRNRDYPAELMGKVILGLEDLGWAIVLFGQPGQIPPLPPEMRRTFIFDSSQSEMSLRESVSILSVCDAFVGVDSAFIHFCHALDIPAVGLFGAFPWQIRTAKAPLTRTLTGRGDCAGCCWQPKMGRNGFIHFPPHGPCSKSGICEVLASIEPERIIAQVEKLKP